MVSLTHHTDRRRHALAARRFGERRPRLSPRPAANARRDGDPDCERAARRGARPERTLIADRRSAAAGGLRAPAWLLKAGSVCTALVVLAGGMGYATSHVYSASAPLQPPLAKASPTAMPSVGPVTNARSGGRQATVPPQATIAPGLRTTGRQPITTTHNSGVIDVARR